MRISDMIAYIVKDRQDVSKAKIKTKFSPNKLGKKNPEIISAIITDIVANSLEKPYLSMSTDVLETIKDMLEENKKQIYQREEVIQPYYDVIQPMMELLYEYFGNELSSNQYKSPIYQHYLNGSVIGDFYRHHEERYIQTDIHNINDIIADFIASMTDDYFIDVFKFLLPDHELNKKLCYIEYY